MVKKIERIIYATYVKECEMKERVKESVAKSERESERREVSILLMLPRPANSLRNGAGLTAKT